MNIYLDVVLDKASVAERGIIKIINYAWSYHSKTFCTIKINLYSTATVLKIILI